MKTRTASLLSVVAFVFSMSAQAQKSEVYTDKKNVAIKGYDVVSYYDHDSPMKGSKKYSVDHEGATFYFANKENMKAFKKSPEKYMPKYGGYCAFAMGAKNKKVPSDPNTYELENGELYLFFNGKMKGKKMNTKIPWDKQQSQLKPKADKNWAKMHGMSEEY